MSENEIIEAKVENLPQAQAITPLTILERAIDKGADVDQLEKLMALQERWEASEAKKAYVQAMAQFRKKCPKISKSKTAHNSMYAGLAETIDQIKETMSECGLSHSWETTQADGMIQVTCLVTHIMGHTARTTLSGEPDSSGSKNKIQAVGSTVSYLERYTLFAALGLASSDMDNDGDMPVEYLSEEQANKIYALIDETGADKALFLKYAKVDVVEDIRASDFDKAVAALNAKKGAK